MRRTGTINRRSYSRFVCQAVKQRLTLFANLLPQFTCLASLTEQLFGDLQSGQHRHRLGVGRAGLLLDIAEALVDQRRDRLYPTVVLVGLERVPDTRDLHRHRMLHGSPGSIPPPPEVETRTPSR